MKDWAAATRTLAVSACAIALLGAVGCSSSGPNGNAGNQAIASRDRAAPRSPNMAAQLIGPECDAYAEAVPEGPGSVSGMAAVPVATAASNNVMLTRWSAAVSGKINPKVHLVDLLNGRQLTVFTPVDAAFEAVPPATMVTLSKPANSTAFKKLLAYHVLKGRVSPDGIVGTHSTLEGEDLEVTGSGENLQVNGAHITCGGITTTNATVYLIDAVLMPQSVS